MAHEVKIDVYTIQVKKRNKKQFVAFDKFYSPIDPDTGEAENKIEKFEQLFTDYIKSFDSKFWVQEQSGKAISLVSEKVKYSSRKRIIKGILEGGITGIGSKIKKKDDVTDENAFQVTTDDVEAIPYYFLFWLPNDSNVGLLLVQGFGSKTISETFKAHFRKFFSDSVGDHTLIVNELIPKELEKQMRNDGVVNTVILRRHHLPSDKAEKILGLEYVSQEVSVEVKITGLKKLQGIKEKIKEYINHESPALFDISSLEDFGIDGKHETIIQFEHNGKVAQGKASENFKLAPSYYVADDDISRDINMHPTYESIENYCISFLETLKKEINYQPTKG